MLVATNQRVLLIDKKPLYLTLEDIRYDMMAEVDYNHRLMNASILIVTPSKTLRFVAYNNDRLRKLFHFVQQRVMEIRQHYQHLQEYQQYAQVPQPTPIPEAIQAQLATPAFEPFLDQEKQQALPFEATGRRPVEPTEADTAPQPVQYSHPMAHRAMVAPIISAYTRLPMMSRQRRFLGSRAVNQPRWQAPRAS